mmetsp:Transcript_21190/g.59647  ORF Transcript_21190/g.59647 Transcript_21190/m.59647 type:complete len:301 (-) Transcript_21190:978-1880(-)
MADRGDEEGLLYGNALECQICLSSMVDPRVLHCGHSFCFSCIQGVQAGDLITCPLCRKPMNVGAEGPPVNFFLLNLLDSIRQSRIVEEKRKFEEAPVDICPKHKLPLHVYCTICSLLSCASCSVLVHQSHDLADPGVVAGERRQRSIDILLEYAGAMKKANTSTIQKCRRENTTILEKIESYRKKLEELESIHVTLKNEILDCKQSVTAIEDIKSKEVLELKIMQKRMFLTKTGLRRFRRYLKANFGLLSILRRLCYLIWTQMCGIQCEYVIQTLTAGLSSYMMCLPVNLLVEMHCNHPQ